MQCKSLYCVTITDVSAPYNRTGINHAYISTASVTTKSHYFYCPTIITLKNLTKKLPYQLKIKNILRLSLFLLPAYCTLSMALAINDVAIKSSLGEPLIAEINITDVEKSPDIRCFSVSDSNASPAFTNASLAIKHQADGYQLIIKSQQTITEPILNLRATHHCDPNINRDYVVLLDPPLQNDVKVSTTNSATTSDATQSFESSSRY
jgi:hypothetical protein